MLNSNLLFLASSWARNAIVWAQITLKGYNEVGQQKRCKITLNHGEKKKDSGNEGFGNGM